MPLPAPAPPSPVARQQPAAAGGGGGGYGDDDDVAPAVGVDRAPGAAEFGFRATGVAPTGP